MRISSLEIQNFRRLKSTHIDFGDRSTIFVGANNSGKTSAMIALRYFLISPNKLSLHDITVTNWARIDVVGNEWEQDKDPTEKFESLLPALDVWLDVPLAQIHHVAHILPTIDWKGGLLGVRLQYKPSTLENLKAAYLRERAAALKIIEVKKGGKKSEAIRVWPASLTDFLKKRLTAYLEVEAYVLDPEKRVQPNRGVARPQQLPNGNIPLDKNPFKGLIKIDEIAAQRDFADAGDRGIGDGSYDQERGARKYKKKLSDQLRSYYDRHLDPANAPSAEDYDALSAIQRAEKDFDERLKEGFADAFKELEGLGYPGISNPGLEINTQLRTTDALKHGSAVQYRVADPTGDGSRPLQLPEDYSGLGYQNLISMVFMLMTFRDEWMRVGKSRLTASAADDDRIPPLHLVLIEEPEAHLHAQVQQVFIKKAYDVLRKHEDLGGKAAFSTQLVVSTHSSHIAHEAEFSDLRYFRRRRAKSQKETPTTTVSNLSYLFGEEDKTQRFVQRYLKVTHCDLFFADGAIFVEGQAERMLVPHFIRHHFDEGLSRRYITIIDLGGSHAHSFKNLVDELGLNTLIIADLDATKAFKVQTAGGGESTRWKAVKPETGQGQKTSNPVLKSWHPSKADIDDLLALEPSDHIAKIDEDSDLYVAFQKQISFSKEDGRSEKVIPRTFEDALIYANQGALSEISGSAASEKIRGIIERDLSGQDLANELFELLKNAEKAAFALDCLMLEDPKALLPPPYIQDGLAWLERALAEQTAETPPPMSSK